MGRFLSQTPFSVKFASGSQLNVAETCIRLEFWGGRIACRTEKRAEVSPSNSTALPLSHNGHWIPR